MRKVQIVRILCFYAFIMKRILHFFLLFFSILVFSQNIESYNQIYNKTFLVTAQKNFPAAIKTADSLFAISETPELQTRSLMLSANLYFQKGNVENSVELALKAKNIIESTDNYLMQSKIYGFLSSLYMDLNLYNQSKEYFNKCLKVSDLITDKEVANNLKGVIFQERAQAEIKFKRYENSINYIINSQKYFGLVNNPKAFNNAFNEQLLGRNYYFLKDYDAAFMHYNKALNFSRSIPNSYINAFIYSGLALIYIDKKEVKNARKYINLAEQISGKSQFLALKKELNDTTEKYYKLTNDLNGLLEVQKKQDVVVEKLQKQKDSFVDKSINDLKDENGTAHEKISTGKLIIIICAIFLTIALLHVLMSRKKSRADYENFQKIMSDLHSRVLEQEQLLKENINLSEVATDHKEEFSKSSERIMIDSTEIKLLKKLEKFENSTLFTKKTISLSTLSTYCETNPRYLSHVINSHKEKDFNNYISDLRIKYIIAKLESNPKYRKYKIAALAEESGFSSSNKFAMIFKKVTHISPSVFIKYLDDKLEKEEDRS